MEISKEVEDIILKYESIIDRWNNTKSLSLNTNQCKELESVSIILGWGYVNCSCGSCKSSLMNHMVIALKTIRDNKVI